jgi:hypothetical protein
MNQKVLNEMASRWPSNVVARRSIREFTGGLYSTKYLANEDCAKRGPEGGFQIGGQKCYPVASVIQWLKNKSAASWAERVK